MKDKLFLKYLSVILVGILLIPNIVQANSSWSWLNNSRPIYLLPFAIVATLLIEIIMITKLNKIKEITKSIVVIGGANIISFVVPYLIILLMPDIGYTSKEFFIAMMEKGPSYIVGLEYLFFTLIIEVPIVYNFFKKNCENKIKLLTVIVMANVITTVLVAVLERIICVGHW